MSSKLEKLSQVAVITIAIAAIFVSVWQTKVLRDHNKLSVRPLMDFVIFTSNSQQLELTIANRGIGPAIIEKITYNFEEKEYTDWDSVLEAAGVLENVKSRTSYGPNTVFSPDIEHTILVITKTEKKRLGITVEMVYQSIYEEIFTMKLGI